MASVHTEPQELKPDCHLVKLGKALSSLSLFGVVLLYGGYDSSLCLAQLQQSDDGVAIACCKDARRPLGCRHLELLG
jgi:hypothetical protein